MIDIETVRADTPACADQVFLDSAGSSLPPRQVVDTVVGHLRREAEVGGYRAATERAEDLAALPLALARVVGGEAGTIALTDSATRAWAQFVSAVPLERGDRVLITGVEYASNAIMLLQRVRAAGISVEVVPSDAAGRVDLEALDAMIDDRVRLVSLVHVPSTSGIVNPVREVVDLAHRHGALVVLDACQSVGQIDVDVQALGVDALSATGRKWLRAPRGTGFLYVRPGLASTLEPAVVDLHGGTWTGADAYELAADATRFQLWEGDVAGRLGLGVAAELLLRLGPAEVERAVAARGHTLRSLLGAVPGVNVHDHGDPLCGIVTFTVDGIDPAQVKGRLEADGVTVTVGGRHSTLLDLTARGLTGIVRASPHYFVTDAQLEQAAAAVAHLR
ncbi:aminotransferase class V-fold PLP-dependent enzyme [Aeromicrobium marinum]|uniref:aminotransferase class V-fold PLP-dependent enzyme n=1 Tax=Aeromicrobium marinum TaxID=219314 RepID=UPI00058FAE44|nr:aminotransferase class V-fold PLP-dependent enzyme [Aeromicrobium marinum]